MNSRKPVSTAFLSRLCAIAGSVKEVPLESYRDLIVWQKSMLLVQMIYAATLELPATERFGLLSQMRRAAVSIPSNIAEGSRRKSTPEFMQFLRIADGSAAELETQLLLVDVLYPNIEVAGSLSLVEEIKKMIFSVRARLQEKQRTDAL